jgi:hypothetical protein
MQKRRARWANWLVSGTAAFALGLLTPSRAGAQALVPEGAEFQVDAYTALSQVFPSVAADADGDFVVVWSCDGVSGTDTGSLSIQGQRYASDGSAQGAQFQVNTYTTGDQRTASVAVAPDGDFVVVWESIGSYGTDTSSRSVQGQRYASDGSPQGAEFQVNTYTTQSQIHAAVAADADGDFVVVWDSNGSTGTDTSYRSIQGQRYNSAGSKRGTEFQINTFTTNYQRFPSVAADAEGNFVVVWHSYGSSGTDTSSYSIQGQRYRAGGATRGAEFQVNTYTTAFQRNPSVAADIDGDFVVVWQSYGSSGTDTSGYSIQGQRYTSGGSTEGAEFQVNTYATSDQEFPSVATAAAEFVVVWDSFGSSATDTSSESIQGQRFTWAGSTRGAQFQINTYTTNSQRSPFVVADAGGDFVVVWQSYESLTGPNGSIQGQRYRVAAAVPSMSSTTRFALTAALMLLGAVLARAYGSVSRRTRFSR